MRDARCPSPPWSCRAAASSPSDRRGIAAPAPASRQSARQSAAMPAISREADRPAAASVISRARPSARRSSSRPCPATAAASRRRTSDIGKNLAGPGAVREQAHRNVGRVEQEVAEFVADPAGPDILLRRAACSRSPRNGGSAGRRASHIRPASPCAAGITHPEPAFRGHGNGPAPVAAWRAPSPPDSAAAGARQSAAASNA